MKDGITPKVVALIVILCIIGGLWFVRGQRDKSIVMVDAEGHLQAKETTHNIRSIVSTHSKDAKQRIMDELSAYPYGLSHLVLHIVGESVYRNLGVGGIDWCDDSYGYGCYHGFFGAAIADGGVDMLEELDAACIARHGELGLGCQHGIGHGLGEYYGATGLQDQLEACKRLSWKGVRFGCSGGVFMEYNFPTIVGEASATNETRMFDAQHPYHPCDQISSYRESCYFELGSWLYEVFHDDAPRVEALCIGIGSSAYTRECISGYGLTVSATSGYARPVITDTCLSMEEAGSQASCLAGASWALFAHPQHRDDPSLCSIAPESHREQCRIDSDLLAL